ncbi:response regulator transcription factor [Roseiconus nitratireducens]|uniref:Response regulator transcription factor n=1 Tax=Roseiconus nitratireducens TaxID=2605748 RepID=A0A5M6D2Z0_9BACT|nr:response regulator transcription factor [Roseiconus nitratireducens]KAA5540049.1 response regulator transcription factor [Roseiconus nitratireducens]
MTKTVVDCGNCGPDFHSIRQFVTANFDAVVVQTHDAEETLKLLRQRSDVALVTVNRKLDRDYSDGIEVVRQIKSAEDVGDVPVMLVTNYEEHQQSAMQAGCVRGFGKLALRDNATAELLQPYLGT